MHSLLDYDMCIYVSECVLFAIDMRFSRKSKGKLKTLYIALHITIISPSLEIIPIVCCHRLGKGKRSELTAKAQKAHSRFEIQNTRFEIR